MKRVLLAVGLLLLVMSLAAPAISAQGNANVSNRIRGSMKLRSASPDQARHISGPARTATAKALREHGYLVRNQAAYDRAKAAAAARAPQAQAKPAGPASVSSPKVLKPLIQSGDPDIGPAVNGLSDATVTPPDTTGAIGTSRYVELVNDKFGIYDRNGGLLSSGNLWDFLQADTDIVTDPQVIWDPGTNRFYFVGLEFSHSYDPFNSPNFENRLYVGFSRTASPSAPGPASWCAYYLPYFDTPGFPGLDMLPDYPKLGDTSDFWTIGTNNFDSFGPSFYGADLTWITKPPSGTGCPSPGSFLASDTGPLSLDDTSMATTPVPVNQIDTSHTGYVLATPDGSDGFSHSFVDSYAVTKNSDGSAHVGAPVHHTVNPYTMPPAAPQSGTAATLDTLDARLTQAVSAIDPSQASPTPGVIWTQHTVLGGAGSAVDWYEIDPNVDAPLNSAQVGNVSLSVFNAAISPDRLVNGSTTLFGDTFVIGFNTSSSSDFVRIQMVSKYAANPMSEFVEVRASPGYNEDFTCTPTCRWGDYAGVTPDPAANTYSNHGRMWFSNQWNVASADSGGVDWRTYNWATNPVPFVVLNGPGTLFQKSTKFTVAWFLGNQASLADVRYRSAPWNGSFGGYTLWRSQVPAGSATFTGGPGNTYCFSAQSYDDIAGPGTRPWGWTTQRCAAVPLDDRSLSASSGWSRRTGSGFFLNTFTQSTLLGKTLTRTGIHGKNIQLLVERCPTCGSIKIYWNNVLKHSYSLHASRVQKLVYLAAVSFGSPQIGTLKIVVTTSGKPVIIDGLAVSAV